MIGLFLIVFNYFVYSTLSCIHFHSEEFHYIGRAGEFRGIKYCGGGAGYVVSRALLKSWGPLIPQCKRLPVGEDVSVGLVK